jgi:hypothetical protein
MDSFVESRNRRRAWGLTARWSGPHRVCRNPAARPVHALFAASWAAACGLRGRAGSGLQPGAQRARRAAAGSSRRAAAAPPHSMRGRGAGGRHRQTGPHLLRTTLSMPGKARQRGRPPPRGPTRLSTTPLLLPRPPGRFCKDAAVVWCPHQAAMGRLLRRHWLREIAAGPGTRPDAAVAPSRWRVALWGHRGPL